MYLHAAEAFSGNLIAYSKSVCCCKSMTDLDKISRLRISLTSNPAYFYFISTLTPTAPSNFSSFGPASEFEISKIYINCPNKQSDSDPIPTITNIVNLALTTGQSIIFAKNSLYPHLSRNLLYTKTNSPTTGLVWPISNLSFISKVIERVVKCRLTDHLVSKWSSQSSPVCLLQAPPTLQNTDGRTDDFPRQYHPRISNSLPRGLRTLDISYKHFKTHTEGCMFG